MKASAITISEKKYLHHLLTNNIVTSVTSQGLFIKITISYNKKFTIDYLLNKCQYKSNYARKL